MYKLSDYSDTTSTILRALVDTKIFMSVAQRLYPVNLDGDTTIGLGHHRKCGGTHQVAVLPFPFGK